MFVYPRRLLLDINSENDFQPRGVGKIRCTRCTSYTGITVVLYCTFSIDVIIKLFTVVRRRWK